MWKLIGIVAFVVSTISAANAQQQYVRCNTIPNGFCPVIQQHRPMVRPPVVIAAPISLLRPVHSVGRPVVEVDFHQEGAGNDHDGDHVEQLNRLLAERAHKLLGAGPAGSRYEGYEEVAETSPAHPCKSGYHPMAGGREDPATHRFFVRCAAD